MKKHRGRIIPEGYDELCEMWESYNKEYGKYPNSVTCNNNFNLPSWTRVKDICGDRFKEFKEVYSLGKPSADKYSYYCDLIKEFAKELGRTPTIKELRNSNKGIPEYRWLVNNCPDKNVNNFNDFVTYLNMKPKYFTTKEMATKIVLEKIKKNNGQIKASDFKNPTESEIGHGTINRIWGSFNNMLTDLKIPINQIGRTELVKPLVQMESEIKQLCEYLHNKNGHKLVTITDIENCEWCSRSSTYNRAFLKEYNMTIGEYITNLGYKVNDAGMGMVYEFEDGEITTSKYEYAFTNFLRKNNIKYSRNIKYKDFVSNYKGNKDCDYVIESNGEVYYVELAGMLRDYKSIEHAQSLKLHYIHQKYLKDLLDKEEMLKESKVKYYILFPHQITDEDFLIELHSTIAS